MLHEIEPHRFDISYETKSNPAQDDYVIIFDCDNVMLKGEGDNISIPCFQDVKSAKSEPYYLFSVDEKGYYTYMELVEFVEGVMENYPLTIYREVEHFIGFPIATAWHLYNWKRDNRFCGRCGKPMSNSDVERACVCTACKHTVYPKISPAVAVAIIDGDRILLARNCYGRFRKFALVAGYVEVGETFEQTVRREVKEEVGLELDEIKYYKSSPWGSSGAEMIGFFATLKGSDKITCQESEIAEARWFTREELDPNLDELSLSYEMIARFRDGKEKELWQKD